MTGLLLALLFGIFFQGAGAWRLSDSRADLQAQAALFLQGLTSEVQQSSASSLAVEGEAVSFLSARDGEGRFHNSEQGRPEWQKVIVYYRHPEGALRRRELALTAPQSTSLPIQELDLGSGLQPLAFYASEGKVAVRLVRGFTPSRDGPSLLTVVLDLEQQVDGRPERTTSRQLRATISLRNR